MKTIKATARFTLHNCLLIISMVFLFSDYSRCEDDIYLKIAKSIDVFGRVYREVAFNYVDQLSPEEFMQAGIAGMLGSLDPYTVFIDAKGKEDIEMLTNGQYGGIGVSIGIRNEKITVLDLIEGYSAQRQGIRIGDAIIKINTVEINKNNYEDLSKYIKGEPGTEVSVTVQREGRKEPVVFNLIREEIKLKNLTYYGFMPENSNNAYLKLSGFSRSAGDEVKKALVELKGKKEIKSLVLDLRGNPGGLLDAAVNICEKFLKKNQLVVSVIGRDTTNIRKYYADEEPIAGQLKMVVLVDNNSASASEIVAGALQDHDRAVIVGAETYGKGLVQTILPLSYSTSLKITTAKYFTPSGRCIQKIDYSRNNKVFSNGQLQPHSVFSTDNKRKVYEAGGIKPDSIVSRLPESNIVRDMLAKGIFFRFANYYFNLNPKNTASVNSNEKIFEEFVKYLSEENYEYSTVSENQLKELIKTTEDEKYNKTTVDELKQFSARLKNQKNHEISVHKSEVVAVIKEELTARYEGTNGRIKESLKNDKQYETAYNLLCNDTLYNRLLHN